MATGAESEIPELVANRFIELVKAPFVNQDILWLAIPLAIATLFITLYFGKYKKEELGWNTAFGNTMVFLFVSIDLIRKMFYATPGGSWDNLFSNTLYLTITVSLAATGLLFMLITYYHLLPRKWAFFIFSNPPVNVSLYVIMTIVYGNVTADWITGVAGVVLFGVLFIILRMLQFLEHMAGKEEGLSITEEEKSGKLAEKFKHKTEQIKRKKELDEKIDEIKEEIIPKKEIASKEQTDGGMPVKRKNGTKK